MKDFPSKNNAFNLSHPRIAVVVSRYHESVTGKLAQGATDFIRRSVKESFIKTFWVSGAFELPQAAALLARSKEFDAIVPLGCLVKGETPHFDFICQTVSAGLDEVARQNEIPVAFGVLTVENLDQANERAGGRLGNKGEEAAQAVLDLLQLKAEVSRGK